MVVVIQTNLTLLTTASGFMSRSLVFLCKLVQNMTLGKVEFAMTLTSLEYAMKIGKLEQTTTLGKLQFAMALGILEYGHDKMKKKVLRETVEHLKR